MALNKKYIGKVTEQNLDDWLHSAGFLYPKNEKHLDRFNKLYEDYECKLKNISINIEAIIKGTLCNKGKVISMNFEEEISSEIDNLKMVARKGEKELPQHIIEKMKNKHKKPNDKEQF